MMQSFASVQPSLAIRPLRPVKRTRGSVLARATAGAVTTQNASINIVVLIKA